MNTLCLHSIDEVRPHAEQLEAVNRASTRKSPFTTFAFLDTFIRHDQVFISESPPELWFLIAMQGGAVVGYLALWRLFDRVGPFKAHRLELMGAHDVLVAAPEHEEEVSAELHRYLLSRGAEWSLLEFQQQRPGSALTPPPRGADVGRYFARTFPGEAMNAVPVKWPTLAAYFGSLKRKFRQNVRRQVRQLMAQGKVTIVASMDPSARTVLFELAALAAIGSRTPGRIEQFRALLSARQPMQLWICVVLIDGRPVAASLCGDYENTLYDLLELYDASLAKVAPVTTLRLIMMRHAILKRYGSVDLLAGDASTKARWLAQTTPTVRGQLFRKGSLLYWKARLGDLKRRYTAVKAPRLRSGLAPPEPARSRDLAAEELRRVEALLSQLEPLQVDRLSHAELALLLPFDTHKPARSEARRKAAAPISLSSRMH